MERLLFHFVFQKSSEAATVDEAMDNSVYNSQAVRAFLVNKGTNKHGSGIARYT